MKAMRRQYKNTDDTRDASIEIVECMLPETGFNEPGYEVRIFHSCWTGHEWLRVNNTDYAWTLDDAIKLAKSARDSLGFVAA